MHVVSMCGKEILYLGELCVGNKLVTVSNWRDEI